ncbi:MAG: zinc ribbon domain-containing protein [Candidatus Brocadiia bacterium]
MREEIKMLIQLQELDATVQRLKQTKDKLAMEAAEADRASAAEKQTLTDKSSEAKSFRMALDKRELDLKEVEGRIKKLEVQLNTVKSNKEYAAFQHEILGLKADKSRIEDEILKMFEQSEQQQKEIKQLAAKAADASAAMSERRKAIQAALQDADARVERVQKERAELSAKIPPAFRNPYERLLTRADGRAMAACRNYVCSGCRMSLTANTVSLLMGGDKLIYCQSCGRILYLADDEDLTGVAGAGRKDSW